MKILIRAPNWLGDAVLAVPALSALHASFPEAPISVVAKPSILELYRGLPGLDAFHVAPASNPAGRLRDLPRLGRLLRGEGFDLGIAFPGAFSAALLLHLAGARTRVGYAMEGRARLLTHAIPTEESEGQHLADQYLHLVRAAGANAAPAPQPFPLSAEEEAAAARLLDGAGIGARTAFIAMAPGATYGPAKRWPAERFGELAWHMAERYGLPVVLLGSDAEKEDAALVAARGGPGVRNLTGLTTVRTLAAVLGRALLLVSNDSGVMHLAADMGTPVVAIFGSTAPDWTGPRGDGHRVISRQLPCAPCFQRTCDIGYVCLRSIPVSEVFAEVGRALFTHHRRVMVEPARRAAKPPPSIRIPDEGPEGGPVEVNQRW